MNQFKHFPPPFKQSVKEKNVSTAIWKSYNKKPEITHGSRTKQSFIMKPIPSINQQ